MTFLELLLIGICVLLALIAVGVRFAVGELREIKLHLAAAAAHREHRGEP
jgi:CBS domain containing-hemolysin-like protein